MKSYAFGRLAAVVTLGVVSAGLLCAQGGGVIVTNPSELTFDVSNGVPPAQDVEVSRPNGGIAVVDINVTPGITATPVNTNTAILPFTLRVSVNPAVMPAGSSGDVIISGVGLTTKLIKVRTINPSASSFFATPNAVTFTQTGTTTPNAVVVAISTNTGTIPAYTSTITYNSGGLNWLALSPPPLQPTTSSSLTFTPVTAGLSAGLYSATVRLTAAGFPTLAIPVTLSIDQAAGTPLTVNPTGLTFTGSQALSQTVTVNTATPVAFTVSLSPNLIGLVQTPSGGTTSTSFQVSVQNLQSVPFGTTGSITLTPTAGSGYTPVIIPITINPQGLSTLTVNPTALTFTGVIGSTVPVDKQLLSITSTDFAQRQVQITATSTSNFLTVDTPFPTTPASVPIGINMAGITQPGTYYGTLAITPLTGGGSATFVQVTLNVIQPITVTPDQTSVTLTAPAGSNLVQRSVSLSSSVPNVAFTATATATTGGNGWLSVATSSSTLPATITISANPAGLATGTYTGSIVIATQGVTVATIPVTLTVTPAATLQLSPTSLVFNYETSSSSLPLSQPVQITSNGANMAWTASIVSSGSWIMLNSTSGTTPGALSVSVNPTGLSAGTYTGSISIASSGASNSPQTVNVTLNVTTPAVPLVTSFQNAGSFEQSLAVPGSIITIRGTNLGPTTGVSGEVTGGFLQTTAGEVEILFDGIPAPIIYASATQLNAVVPYEVYGRTTTRLQVRYRNQRSQDLELRVQDSGPGIFTSNASGSGQAAALNQNNSINSAANPEQRGNVIVLYATGQGQTTPGGTTGRIMTGADLRRPLATVTVRIGGQNAEVLYAGSAPGLVAGAMQINARIPTNSILGPNIPVQVQVGNAGSQANVTISVQ